MSASEKLKALDARWDRKDWPLGDDVGAIFEALPQIVAVVEAAEWCHLWDGSPERGKYAGTTICSRGGIGCSVNHTAVDKRLAALDEALP